MSKIVGEDSEFTTIRVKKSTRTLLLQAGTKEETYDDLLLRLLRKNNGVEPVK